MERIAALHAYEMLDTPPEPCFDRLTRLVAHLFKSPFAFLTFLDRERVFIKSCFGVQGTEAPRSLSFCSHTIESDEVLIVPDATLDPRFAGNPFVAGTPGIRFYAGAPLITNGGLRIGAICAIDVIPHTHTGEREIALLRDLSAEAVEQIEHRVVRRNLISYTDALERRDREFREHQSRLHKSEATAALALEAGQMGYWEWDAATGRSVLSPLAQRIFGLQPDTFDGSREAWLSCLHPEDRERIEKEIRQLQDEASDWKIHYRIMRSDGELRWVVVKGTFHRDASGRVLGGMGVCWDATERENRIAELRASEELFRGLSVSCPLGIFRANLDGYATYVNPRTTAILDMPESEALGFGWVSRIHPEDIEALVTGWTRANASGRNYEHEYRMLLPNGEIRWAHGRSAIIHDRDGKPVGTVGTVDDITARKQVESALREAKAEAEAANCAKDLFLANVSHELRTPLNGILGMTELLCDASLSAEQKECAETVRQSADSLLSVVNDILDISRIEAGTLRIDAAPFDLRATVNRAAGFVRATAVAKGLAFSIDYPDALPSFFIGDCNRIQQILVNFMTNAVKFTDRGSVNCEVRLDGIGTLSMAVRDTGTGISDEAQARLFQPFSQVDASSTRRHGGVGLGLAISRRLAELMGGSVGVTSAVNRGSTFWFKLNLALGTATAESPVARVALPLSGMTTEHRARVLIAEDNVINQRVVTRMLQKLGWEWDLACDGEMAVQLAKTNQYGVILMDCQMPGADGYSASSKIREHEASNGLCRTPIIALTANVMPGDRDRCLAAGMDDYLPKPLQLEQLRATLVHWSRAVNELVPATP